MEIFSATSHLVMAHLCGACAAAALGPGVRRGVAWRGVACRGVAWRGVELAVRTVTEPAPLTTKKFLLLVRGENGDLLFKRSSQDSRRGTEVYVLYARD